MTAEAKSAMTASDRFALGLGKALVFFRWPVVILGIASVVAAAYGGQFLSFSNNYRYFFAPENPQYKAFVELQDVYSKRDNLVFVLRPHDGNVFTPKTLGAIRWLTDEGWKLPFVMRTDSIANYQHTQVEGDDLMVADLVKDASTLDQAGLDRVRDITTNEPLLKNRLIAPDGHAAGVFLTMIMPETDPVEAATGMKAARVLVEQFRARYPDIEIRVSGSVALSNAFGEATQSDITTLVPLMYLVVALTSLVLLRSFGAMFCVMIVLTMATVAAMGLAGWLHITLTPPSALSPVIILTLAIAESVHVIHNFLHEMRLGRSKFDAIIESTRVNFGAITLTSITNAIGFLSLNAADAPPFRDLGNIVSLGVLTTWVYALLFLPALLAVLPISARANLAGEEGGRFMRLLANFVIRLRIPLAVVLTGTTIYLGAQIPKIELNDQFVNWFDRSIEFRRDTDFLIEHLTGIYTVDYSLKSGESNGIANPEFLNKVENFANWARAEPNVLHVFTITDIMKRLNKNLNGDDPAFYRVPEDRQLAAQYLLLYELSLPLGLDLNDTINVDKSATRVIVTLKGVVSAVDTRAFKAKADAWIAQNIPTSAGVEGASPAIMFSFIAQRNIDANLYGTGWAMLAISFFLIVPFRSLRLGLISMIPNFVPIIMTFGVWYYLVGRLGMASSIVTATSLGIVVDSTIHLLSKYIRGRRELNLTPEDAVRYSFSTVGPALWILTAALLLGFLVLSLSPFEVNRAMGLLTALCIVFAIVADFFLLPPLLMLVDRRKRDRVQKAAPAE
ncbi:MAG: MMPL family transporter [Micropepsaceae bacterium]